ncbi:hypothetical protein [Marinomonas fungiae]|uniref:hypothetical protein n=1 Tax=Marinomonas fungiae TaxID=1137284 RepID=UPI003A927532
MSTKIDINKFYELAREDISKLIDGAAVNSSAIFNASGEDVNFAVYNYIDVFYEIPAQEGLVAKDYYGTVAASGTHFKVNPNKVVAHQFLVKPGKAYVYRGPGKLEEI